MGLELKHRAALGRLEQVLRRHFALKSPAPPCPELNCVRARLNPETAAALEQRAADAGVCADRVLLARGILDEEEYVRALAHALDMSFEPLDQIERGQCPLDDQRLLDASPGGIIPLRIGGQTTFVVAPRGLTGRRLSQGLHLVEGIAPGQLRLTTTQRLDRFIRKHTEGALGARATDALRLQSPELSAGPTDGRRSLAFAVALAILLVLAFTMAFNITAAMLGVALAAVFIAWMALRVAAVLFQPPLRRPTRRLNDCELPTYTVLVSLYREVAAIPGLVAALKRLDYPAEKLDVKFVTEADDVETRRAIEAQRPGSQFEIFVAPEAGPRTKPKALNAALPFARGSFTVIYDAEDRPEPDQLRRALDAFQAGGDRLACVQASLTIDNAADNWLTGFFAAEYAGHFDVFLPALAAFDQPLPLGGTSNHFRTRILREVGAWDPYNVTEDADLGVRLARFQYRATTIASTTYEEAPARASAWLRQRTRWLKGWMQTWLVHMRAPLRLHREIGTLPFLTFQLIVGGSVLAALVHPVLLLLFAASWFSGAPMVGTLGTAAIFTVAIVAGYAASALLCIAGLRRRKLLHHAWVLAFMPVHWLMLALAAWRALYQLVRDPYRWEKTEHGLARTSRLRRSPDAIIADILATAPPNEKGRPQPAGL